MMDYGYLRYGGRTFWRTAGRVCPAARGMTACSTPCAPPISRPASSVWRSDRGVETKICVGYPTIIIKEARPPSYLSERMRCVINQQWMNVPAVNMNPHEGPPGCHAPAPSPSLCVMGDAPTFMRLVVAPADCGLPTPVDRLWVVPAALPVPTAHSSNATACS